MIAFAIEAKNHRVHVDNQGSRNNEQKPGQMDSNMMVHSTIVHGCRKASGTGVESNNRTNLAKADKSEVL